MSTSRLIRNYQAGQRVLLSESTRREGLTGTATNSAERQKQQIHQIQEEIQSLRREAGEILDQAQAEADRILTEAQEQSAILQAEAQAAGYEEGYRDGIDQGRQQGEAALADMVTAAGTILDELVRQRRDRLVQAETEVVDLALTIAQKVAGKLAAAEEPLIQYTASQALSMLAESGPLVLRLHPEDRQALQQIWQSRPEQAPDASWDLVADPSVARGGCLLLCGPTTVDARLQTQFQTLVEGLGLPIPAAEEAPQIVDGDPHATE